LRRIVHTLALLAALTALVLGIWRGTGVLLTLKRAVVAYVACFGVAGACGLAVLWVTQLGPTVEATPKRVAESEDTNAE
jgi:hypothetical protein